MPALCRQPLLPLFQGACSRCKGYLRSHCGHSARCGTGGIGLFRSEFLYLNCDDYSTEEYQYEANKKVLSDMEGKKVVIRTLDIGADKMIEYFQLPKEENPALGNRALRICLNRPDIFRTQLRALYRASAYGRLSIMFPMITSMWKVREARKICEQVKKGLTAGGIPV